MVNAIKENLIWARVDLASGGVGECCSGHWDWAASGMT